jgi:alkanesulfonate monooxygenase SsuD/methylene tetrahydromethanopterin reductase-like flavin-dependent oxidoreductase (luciferase family)
VKLGLFLPPFNELADPGRVAGLAVAAEQAGWSGFFLWDHMLARPGVPVADAWITMAAAAAATREIRLGAMVTPLSRRRPWVLARQAATLDRLSGGRLVLGAGLGDDGWKEFSSFGEATDPRERAMLLDDSLEVLRRLLAGEEVAFEGKRLAVHSTPFLPRPVQDPLPVWVACRWPHRAPLARAARMEGCFPIFPGSPDVPAYDDVTAVRDELVARGAGDGYDLVIRCVLRGLDPDRRAAVLSALEERGVAWVVEGFDPGVPVAEIAATIAAGPGGPAGPAR